MTNKIYIETIDDNELALNILDLQTLDIQSTIIGNTNNAKLMQINLFLYLYLF